MSEPPDRTLPSRIAAIRARLVALEEAQAQGALDPATYEARRRDAERALSDAVLAAPAAEPEPLPAPVATRPSRRLVAVLTIVVLAVAFGGYAFTGSPSLAGLGARSPAPVAAAPAGSEREVGLQQIAEMVDKLATRLKEQPDDAEGWTMLARSYTVLSRYAEAIPAYRHAVALQPDNAALLADYSDVVAANNGGQASAESQALIDRALVIDPAQPKALALSGTIAFDRGDYAMAVRQWQKIADVLPSGSEFHQQVVANIDEARRRGGIAAPPAKAAKGSTATAGHEALSGTVTLAPALAAQAAPDDTVFVLARPESGRMPLAVFRATVKDLPLRFHLDDSMAMTPTMKISDMKHVIVAARISRSGNAISQPGDLLGESGPVAPGTTGLAIEIGHAVPGK